jgi:LPPG:FO 2-phospho-L-lactate transferase
MSDQPIPTVVHTDKGAMPFQEYFVHRNCQPKVKGFRFEGAESSEPAPGVVEALRYAGLVLICPSNPWVSIAPILAVPGVRAGLTSKRVAAVSPIVGGKALKGPAAKMYQELGIEPSAVSVARHYGKSGKDGILTGFVLDTVDAAQLAELERLGLHGLVTDTIMRTSADRARLASEIIRIYADE